MKKSIKIKLFTSAAIAITFTLAFILQILTSVSLKADTTSIDDHNEEHEPCDHIMYAPYPNTQITVTTRSGKQLEYLRYTGNQTPNHYPYLSHHPSAIWIANGSNKYNCHSYSFIYRGLISSLPNDSYLLWLNSADLLYKNNTGCFAIIYDYVDPTTHPLTNAKAGDIVVWLRSDDPNSQEMGFYAPHSGMISRKSGNKIYVKSKWCEYAVYEHEINDHPYRDVRVGQEDVPRKIVVLRPKHNVDINLNPVFGKYEIKDAATHNVLCAGCGRKRVGTEEHSFVQVGSIRRCSKCGYQDVPMNLTGGTKYEEEDE